MGADLSTVGCGAGPSSLFSLAEWREWRQARKGYSSHLAVSSRYHVNRPLDSKYELSDKILGTGMSGPVRLARGKAGTAIAHRTFAVKTFKKKSGRINVDNVKREVKIYLSLDHPNVARLEDVFDLSSDIHLVMEGLEGGELFDRISQCGAYAEDVAMEACRTMCRAVAYLHSQKPPIVHRDLKPENFLYDKKDSNHLKLIDFGHSTFWDRTVNARMSEYCGTQAYMAPEVMRMDQYTEKCDMFSLGVIFYLLLTGHPPFLSPLDMDRWRPYDQPTFKSVSSAAQSVVRSLLQRDASMRPSAAGVLDSPWLREGAQSPSAAIDATVLKSMQRFSTTSHFRRACLSMMAWSLTSEDRQYLEACFTEMDTNDDGRISLSELKRTLEENFSINSTEATELFRKLDDGDDEICYSDFLAAAMQERVRLHEDALFATFARFDRRNKGFITADDLAMIIDEDFGSSGAKEVWQEIDRDCSGQVSIQDFVNYLTTWEDEPPSPEPPLGEPEQPGPPRLSRTSGARAALAARLIDRQRQHEQDQVGSRPWKSFSPGSTRQPVPDPLQRTGGRLVQSWS